MESINYPHPHFYYHDSCCHHLNNSPLNGLLASSLAHLLRVLYTKASAQYHHFSAYFPPFSRSSWPSIPIDMTWKLSGSSPGRLSGIFSHAHLPQPFTDTYIIFSSFNTPCSLLSLCLYPHSLSHCNKSSLCLSSLLYHSGQMNSHLFYSGHSVDNTSSRKSWMTFQEGVRCSPECSKNILYFSSSQHLLHYAVSTCFPPAFSTRLKLLAE